MLHAWPHMYKKKMHYQVPVEAISYFGGKQYLPNKLCVEASTRDAARDNP